MSDQPTILDRPLDACPVFIDAPARAQERQIDQFYRDPLICVALSGVGQLDELASSLVGVSKDAISGEFHSHLAR
jgi:hypothetical protein